MKSESVEKDEDRRSSDRHPTSSRANQAHPQSYDSRYYPNYTSTYIYRPWRHCIAPVRPNGGNKLAGNQRAEARDQGDIRASIKHFFTIKGPRTTKINHLYDVNQPHEDCWTRYAAHRVDKFGLAEREKISKVV